jgi:hypothetical protein
MPLLDGRFVGGLRPIVGRIVVVARRGYTQSVFRCESGCHLWTGTVNANGYAMRHHTLIHRERYEQANGPAPEGYHVHHTCRVRSCVNLDHLEAVPHRENIKLGVQGAKTRCANGHPFTPENTTVRANGTRNCKTCDKINCRRYYYARKQREGAWWRQRRAISCEEGK